MSMLLSVVVATVLQAGDDRHACGFQPPAVWFPEYQLAVRSGAVPDRSATRTPAPPELPGGDPSALDVDDLLLLPDVEGRFTNPFTEPEMVDYLAEICTHAVSLFGDSFDQIGLFTTFSPRDPNGFTAFFIHFENDVHGIGDVLNPLGGDTPIFNLRPELGIPGDRLQGFVSMWRGTRFELGSIRARTLFGHEIGHRYGVFWSPIRDDKPVQGRTGHWSPRLDAQGSVLEMYDWIGTDPAETDRAGCANNDCFNTGTGGYYSWLDLYAMGLATADEVDAALASSDFRYLDEVVHGFESYRGPITQLSMSDFVDVHGPREPAAGDAPTELRMGWVLMYPPGSPPTQEDIDHSLGLLGDAQDDYALSTLGRGNLDCSLPDLGAPRFIRGDVNRDGHVTQDDGIDILNWLFRGTVKFEEDQIAAADVDDSGNVNITDAIYVFEYFYRGGAAPPAPFPWPGIDPTP